MQNLTHKDYTSQTATYQLLLPLNMEISIPKDDSVRLLSRVMEDLDYTDLYKAYSTKGRKSAISPKNLFKIIVYGYSTVTPLQEILDFLNKKKEKEKITFVSGTGKRKSILQKSIENLEEMSVQQAKYQGYEEIFEGRNSFSKTDHDATFMRMKEDHMKNGQLKPAYNVQIGVEAEYIVGVDISPERADSLTLIPFSAKMEQHLNDKKYANIIADAGYESEENYIYLEENKQVCYIKPINYERSKLKKHRNNLYSRENMKYDEALDEYTCPNNKKIKSIGAKVRKSKSGHKSNLTVYECENCTDCQYKTSCTKAQGNRRL